MTEEQNKLADEIDVLIGRLRMHAGASDTHIPRPLLASAADALVALREREPATEAVRDAVLEEAACMAESGQTETVELVPGNFRIERSRPATGKEIAAAIRALKGKGASQGMVADTYRIKSAAMGPHVTGAAPAYTGEGVSMLQVPSAAPEASGEFAMLRSALRNCQGWADGIASSSDDNASREVARWIRDKCVAALAASPMSRRDEDAKR